MGSNNTQNYLLKKTNKRKGSSCNYIREIMEESHPQTKKKEKKKRAKLFDVLKREHAHKRANFEWNFA